MKKSITNMFRRVGCKTYKQVSNKKSKNIKIFTSDSDYQNQINEDMKKKRKFIQKYITHTNHTVIILIIGIILSLLLLLTLLHLIGSKYKIKVEYNAITTIVSLLISIPIQIYYINNYIIMESDPKNLIIIYEQINKYLLE